jgi:hypothetical protein
MGYTTIEEISNYLLIEIDPSFEDTIESWIEAMSEYIDNETGRTFEAQEGTKTYEVKMKVADVIGNYLLSVKELEIDECTEITEIKNDDVEITDYLLYPANSTPKTRIKLKEGSFSVGEQNIEVSGKWGYSETPPKDIQFACMVLTAGIILNSWSSEGEVKSVSMGGYSLTFKDEKQLSDFERVKDILQRFRKIEV